jgi:acyl-CoA synthetase (AMP-forming)/AMP-acid ligase II
VPVNTNYRYTDDELEYLWDNADAVAVVFHGTFTSRCAACATACPACARGSGSTTAPSRARLGRSTTRPRRPVPTKSGASPHHGGARGDDLYILYTGGTTGMPKGVMWRQDDMVGSLDAPSKHPLPTLPGWAEFDARIAKPGPRNLPAAPLMHGTGAFNAMWNLVLAGSVVTLPGRHFDPVELLDTIQHHRVNSISIVGDAFAKPILRRSTPSPTGGTSRRCG